ncbi:MAG: hypothetical protein Q9226_008782 [Calogaya cf. arnoldii]
MIAEPLGPLWKKPEYEESLRSRLDLSYNQYLKTIKSLAGDVEKMRNKLGIDASGTVQWDNYSVVEREMKKIKMTLQKRNYIELLDDIDRANQNLREYTQQGIVLEPMKRKRRSKPPIAELKLIRKYAASLYQVLMNEKAWKCSCKTHHMASLRLEARPQTSEQVKTSTPTDYVFRVMITVPDPANTSGVATRWEEIEVIPSVRSQVLNVVPDNRDHHPPKKGVRFASTTEEASTNVPIEPTPGQTDWICIDNICSALCKPVPNRRAIGLLIDDAFDKHQHKLYRADTVAKSRSLSTSLQDLLEASRQPDDDRLSRKERHQIAIVLASSVLQLDGTSWLKTGWSSGDIYFHHENSQALTAAEQHRLPYLSWQPCCDSTMPADGGNGFDRIKHYLCVLFIMISRLFTVWLSCSHGSSKGEMFAGITSIAKSAWLEGGSSSFGIGRLDLNNHRIRNDTLLALGLVLVELCYGRTLTEMRKPEDFDNEGTMTKLRTAIRLHSRVYKEMGHLYGEVVWRCLFQKFDVRELSLDIEEVQQKVLDDVVAPLVEGLNSFNSEIILSKVGSHRSR